MSAISHKKQEKGIVLIDFLYFSLFFLFLKTDRVSAKSHFLSLRGMLQEIALVNAKYARIVTGFFIFTAIFLSCIHAIPGNEWGLEERYEGESDRCDAVILHYDGKTWNHHYHGHNQFLTGIYGFADNDIFAIGNQGLILHYNGKRWKRQKKLTNYHLLGIWGNRNNNVYVVGVNLKSNY